MKRITIFLLAVSSLLQLAFAEDEDPVRQQILEAIEQSNPDIDAEAFLEGNLIKAEKEPPQTTASLSRPTPGIRLNLRGLDGIGLHQIQEIEIEDLLEGKFLKMGAITKKISEPNGLQLTLKTVNGKKTLTISKDDEIRFKGPVDTLKQRSQIPKGFRAQVTRFDPELSFDSENEKDDEAAPADIEEDDFD